MHYTFIVWVGWCLEQYFEVFHTTLDSESRQITRIQILLVRMKMDIIADAPKCHFSHFYGDRVMYQTKCNLKLEYYSYNILYHDFSDLKLFEPWDSFYHPVA